MDKKDIKDGSRKVVHATEQCGELGDQLTAVGTVAIIGAAPLLYVADKRMSVRRKKQIKRKLRELKRYRARCADKFPITMQAWSYFNIVFGIVLAWTDLLSDFIAVEELCSRKRPIYVLFGLLMLLFIILPFILQTITINVYLKSHVSRETYIIARIFTFFLCPVLDMFLPLIYLGSFVCFKHIKILQQVDAVEFRAFLDSYQKIHSVSESFLEALPQTLVQAYIYFSIYCTDERNNCAELSIVQDPVFLSFCVSIINISYNLLGNWLTAHSENMNLFLPRNNYILKLMNNFGGLPILKIRKSLNDPDIVNLDLSMRLALSVNELQSLTQAMEKNHSIKTANLSNLGINADSAMHIADCLKVNQTLQQLNLTNNSIGTKGAKLIAKALEYNYGEEDGSTVNDESHKIKIKSSKESIFDNDDVIEQEDKTRLQELILRANSAELRVRDEEIATKLDNENNYYICCFGPYKRKHKNHLTHITPTVDIADERERIDILNKQRFQQHRVRMKKRRNEILREMKLNNIKKRKAEREQLKLEKMKYVDLLLDMQCFKVFIKDGKDEHARAVVTEFLKVSKLKKIKNKHVVYNNGDVGRQLLIVATGKVVLYTRATSGHPKLIETVTEGEFFGEKCLWSANDYKRDQTCQVASMEGCKLIVTNRLNFEALLREDILNNECKKIIMKRKHVTAVAAKKLLPRPNLVVLKTKQKEIQDMENKVVMDYQVGMQLKHKLSDELHNERKKNMELKLRNRIKARECKLLSEIQLFKHLDKEDLNKAVNLFSFSEYRKNEVIYEQGDLSDKFYIIMEGSVGVYRGRANDESHCKIRLLESFEKLQEQKKSKRLIQQQHIIQPFFGETAMLRTTRGHAIRTATCIATEDTLLMHITTMNYQKLRSRHLFDTQVEINVTQLYNSNVLIQAQHTDSNLGDEAVISLAKMLKRNRTLTRLDIGHNAVHKNGVDALVKVLKQTSNDMKLKRLILEEV